MKELNQHNIKDFSFKRFKAYFLLTDEDLYKLQTVNNCYAQDPDCVEYAFCPFNSSETYYGGLIGRPDKIFNAIIKNNRGQIFESESNKGAENLYQLLVELYKKVNGLAELDAVKMQESTKRGYDVGVVGALLSLISRKQQIC